METSEIIPKGTRKDLAHDAQKIVKENGGGHTPPDAQAVAKTGVSRAVRSGRKERRSRAQRKADSRPWAPRNPRNMPEEARHAGYSLRTVRRTRRRTTSLPAGRRAPAPGHVT